VKQFEPTWRTWLESAAYRWILAGVAVLMLAGLWWLAVPSLRHAAPAVLATAPVMSAQIPHEAAPAEQAMPQLTSAPATVRALREKIAQGPLAGTVRDGELRCDAQGALVPDIGVRRRFDYYAQALGDAGQTQRVSREQIAVLVADDARTVCGGKAAEQAQRLWTAYSEIAVPASPTADRNALESVLAQRSTAREQALGPLWAQVFFGDDDAATQARMARNAPASAPEVPVRDAVAEAQLQEQWADWERRVAAARSEMQQISAGANTQATPAQLNALLDKWFAATERARAAAVLGLPVFES
jgi:lipase chaperone LimK